MDRIQEYRREGGSGCVDEARILKGWIDSCRLNVLYRRLSSFEMTAWVNGLPLMCVYTVHSEYTSLKVTIFDQYLDR